MMPYPEIGETESQGLAPQRAIYRDYRNTHKGRPLWEYVLFIGLILVVLASYRREIQPQTLPTEPENVPEQTLESQLDAVQATLEKMQSQLGSLHSPEILQPRLDRLQSQLELLQQSQPKTLQLQLEKILAKLDTLQSEPQTLPVPSGPEVNLEPLQTQLETIQSQLETMQSQPQSLQVSNTPDFNIEDTVALTDPHPEGRQPEGYAEYMHLYAQTNPWATIENAYYHMLNLRNEHPYGGSGSIMDWHTQWQTYFWFVNRRFREQGSGMKICEIGMGPGYSSLVFLTATTTGPSWKDGAQFYQFDIGFDADSYGPRKKIAVDYINENFGDRVHFHWGDSKVLVPEFIENNPEFKCDVMHIDGDHEEDGVYADVLAMYQLAKNDTIVVMDDYRAFGITQALNRLKDTIYIYRHYTQKNWATGDWWGESVHHAVKHKHVGATKMFILGRYLFGEEKQKMEEKVKKEAEQKAAKKAERESGKKEKKIAVPEAVDKGIEQKDTERKETR